MPQNLFGIGVTGGSTFDYIGGVRAAKLQPRAVVRHPLTVSQSEHLLIRSGADFRRFVLATPTIVLPTTARWIFEPGPGVLRVGLATPVAEVPSGHIGLVHEAPDLFFDRLRNRRWTVERDGGEGSSFLPVRTGRLQTNEAVWREAVVEPAGLLMLEADDVLGSQSYPSASDGYRWFTVAWPENDLQQAAQSLMGKVHANGALLTDRLPTTISTERLVSTGERRQVLPPSDDIPSRQGVRILDVVHHGRPLRNVAELGPWDAPTYRIEPGSDATSLPQYIHWSAEVEGAVVTMVRFPLEPWKYDVSSEGRALESLAHDGLLNGATLLGPAAELLPTFRTARRENLLQELLDRYPRYGLGRRLLRRPEVGEVVFRPSRGGLKAVVPVVLHVDVKSQISQQDAREAAADFNDFLATLVEQPFYYDCRIEVTTHAA